MREPPTPLPCIPPRVRQPSGMYDELNLLAKGTRVFARQLGKADIRGKITWSGPNRYGNGCRYGIRADDGSMHWVDEDAVTPESPPPPKGGIQKGSRVVAIAGPHAGVEGDVYIVGGAGRFGVRDDDEETYWIDDKDLKLA